MKIPSKYKPVDMIPFKISNLDKFIITNHKEYFPHSKEYDLYWTEQIKRCVEGFFEIQKNGEYRYMPGSLYFYGNMCEIKITTDNNQRIDERPFIRDVDWHLSYCLLACEGFSGFESDKERSCLRALKYVKNNPDKLTENDRITLEKYDHLVKKPDGTYKDYVEAREYLFGTFKEKHTGALYLNSAKNLLLLSTRRLGKSYNIANQCLLYDLVFNGAKTVGQFLEKKTSSTTVLGSEIYEKTSELLDKVELSMRTLKYKVGSYFKEGYKIPGAFHPEYSGWDNRKDFISKGIKDKGGKVSNEGSGSSIVHISYNNNASAGVGHGARKMIVEEAGLVSNFNGVHGENSAVQVADTKYGYTVYIGTGGDIEKIKGIRDCFYNPKGYDTMEFENLFENEDNTIGLFYPCYYKNNQFRCPDGNLNVERSFRSEWQTRLDKKNESSRNYLRHVISFPFLPSEMFMQSQGNRFQAEILEDNLRRLESGDFQKQASIGSLRYVDKANRRVAWAEDLRGSINPITRIYQERGLSIKEKNGGIVIYEHPKPYRPLKYVRNPLYITVYDPVAVENDEEGGEERGSSIASVLVVKLWDFDSPKLSYNIVAEYFGRYHKLEDMHNIAFMMADYYNCRLLPEIENQDIIIYAKRIGRYQDLQDTPAFSISELTKKGSVSNKKGVLLPRSKDGKAQMEDFLYEMLETVVETNERIDGSEYVRTEVKAVNNIPSMRVNEELIHYNRDGNFDGVSALLLAALFVRNRALEPIGEYEEEKKQNIHQSFKHFIKNSARGSQGPINTAFEY